MALSESGEIAKFPFGTLSYAKSLTAQGGILRFAQNDRELLRMIGGQAGRMTGE